MRNALFVLTALALACGGAETEDTGATDEPVVASTGEETTDEAEPAEGPDELAGAACQSSADCGDGEFCTGGEGCDVAWTCQPMQPCTRDLVAYCSCEGETVRGSGSCPPEPYAHRGPCE